MISLGYLCIWNYYDTGFPCYQDTVFLETFHASKWHKERRITLRHILLMGYRTGWDKDAYRVQSCGLMLRLIVPVLSCCSGAITSIIACCKCFSPSSCWWKSSLIFFLLAKTGQCRSFIKAMAWSELSKSQRYPYSSVFTFSNGVVYLYPFDR